MNIKSKIKKIRFVYRLLVLLYETYIATRDNVLLIWDCLMRFFCWQPRVLSISETIHYIKFHGCSVCRFGDGEMKLIRRLPINFQEYNEQLSSALARTLQKDSSSKLLVCIPDTFGNPNQFEPTARRYWKRFMAHNRALWKTYLRKEITYGNAFVSRPYMMFKDKSGAREHINDLMSVWEDRHIVVVEGELSRLGVGNELFRSTASITRILCPNKNAWQYKNEIMRHLAHFSKDYIILLALGPTATVLAAELSDQGYQAIDIGHIDIELEWLNLNAFTKIPIAGKEVNEAPTTGLIGDCHDSSYTESISIHIGAENRQY